MSRHQAIRFFRSAAAIIFVAFGGGCALFGGGEVRLERAAGYTLNAPAHWQRKDQDETDYAYRLTSKSLVTVSSSCHRHYEAPVDVLTKQLLIGSRNVVTEKKETLVVDGASGLYSTLSASFEGLRFHLEIFVLTKNECIFDFSLVSPRELENRDRADFLAFIKSFHYGNR